MSSSVPSPLPNQEKIEQYRTHLRQEWTGKETVAAWRKWQAQLAAFTRPITEALMEAAELRPGLRVLDLASGVGDPALSLAEAVGSTGRVTASDMGPDMIALAEELARKQKLTNIEFRIANAEALPFPDASYDVLTCRFGVMFFPDLGKALRECLRVLKPGGRAVFVAWGKREQPFFGSTAGILLKYAQPPAAPDPDAPSITMFGERDRLRRSMESAGFGETKEDVRTLACRWDGSPEEYWEQFTEVAAPFRPLLEKLSPEKRAEARAEVLAALRKFGNDKELTLPLEVVVATGKRL